MAFITAIPAVPSTGAIVPATAAKSVKIPAATKNARAIVGARRSFDVQNASTMRMAKDAVKPFYDDAFIGHLSTPISNSSAVNGLLANLPAYRKGLTPRLRGLEIGMAHGYFLTGPFVELGPLRNTDGGILYGSLSAVGLVVILTACLALYGKANFSGSSKSKDATLWESGEGWSDFVSGWLIGGAGSVGFAYLLLQYIL